MLTYVKYKLDPEAKNRWIPGEPQALTLDELPDLIWTLERDSIRITVSDTVAMWIKPKMHFGFEEVHLLRRDP